MVTTLGAFGALFAAAFVFLTGNGLLNTLLSARMAAEGFSTGTTGIILSCYFTGLLTGSFTCHRLIQQVGHIRAFTVFAATMTATALLHGLYLSPWFWGALRFMSGITTFGLFMVIESWLNECTESRYRGRVFSIYMTLTYLGIGIGQQLLNIGDVQGQTLFIIAGVIFALCLVPVSATEGVHPSLPETKPYHFISIFRRAPLGMLGCMAAVLVHSFFDFNLHIFGNVQLLAMVAGTVAGALYAGGDFRGVSGLGTSLRDNTFIQDQTDDGLVAFIKEGRANDAPDNESGVAMPPYGGNTRLTDEDLSDIVAFLRTLE